MRGSDRDIIQARRALFVAAALSTLSGAARAELPKKPECKRDEPASAEREEEAKALAREGIELSQQGLPDEALDRLQRAFEVTPHPKIALLVANAWRVAASPNDVMLWANAALECGLEGKDRTEAEQLIESTKAASGEIELRLVVRDPGNEEYLDGARIDPNGKTLAETVKLDGNVIDPSARIYVTPGKHALEVQDNFYRRVTVELEIAAGESRVLDVELQPAVMPQVCLQPLVCLSPPPPPNPGTRTRLLLDIGALVLMDVDRDEYQNHGFAGALGLGVSIPFSPGTPDSMRAFLGVEASPSKLRSGLFLPLGARLQAEIPLGRISVGVGVQSGWAAVNGDESRDDGYRPKSGLFFEPYVPVNVWVSDHIAIETRLGFLFTNEARASGESFRLGFYRTGLFLRYAFGAGEDEEELRMARAWGPRRW